MTTGSISILKQLLEGTDLRAVVRDAVLHIGSLYDASRVSAMVAVPEVFATEWSTADAPQNDEALLVILQFLLDSAHQNLFSSDSVLPSTDLNLQPIQTSLAMLNLTSFMVLRLQYRDTLLGVCLVASNDSPEKFESEAASLLEFGEFLSALLFKFVQKDNSVVELASFEALVGVEEDPAALFDDSGLLRFANKSFRNLLGNKSQQFIGQSYHASIPALVAESDVPRTIASLRESFQIAQKTLRLDFKLREATGDNSYLGVIAPLRATPLSRTYFRFKLLPQPAIHNEVSVSEEKRYARLVEHADAIVLRCNAEHTISFISRRSLDFFGVAPEDFIAREPVCWIDLAHPEDRNQIRAAVSAIDASPRSFDEEFRVVNHITGRIRWLLVRFVPVRDDSGILTGWDGFGFDITDRKDAQAALEQQNKRIRALYTVSAAISGFIDPANISSRGLAALCDATNADAALCYLYTGNNAEKLSLVSHHGFSPTFTAKMDRANSFPNLSNYVAESGHPVVVPDMRNDPRASNFLAEQEGIRSAVLVPVQVEDDTLGTIGLFSRELAKFDGGDVMLVSAAASQIGLAARQAQLFTAYRNQTKSLAALYRMSRELTRNLSLEEIFHNAFSIIRDELGLARLWLGMVNETGTRLIGQAAYGPGWKRRLVEMNLEIAGDGNPIAQVVESRKPLVIQNPAETLRPFGFKKIFAALEIHSIVFVPIVADLQVIGVLAVQPNQEEQTLDEERITLLSSLADEIASVVLTKRLEERVSEGDKMRAAGLLAAGIAHNFNNLLQAILGQASLIDMQKDDPQAVSKASRIVVDAANKGSALVKQLLSFAHLEHPVPEVIDVNTFVERNISQFSRILTENQHIRLRLDRTIPRGYIDPQQLARIMTSIIRNAGEAMVTGGTVEVFTDTISITHSNPHFEVPYGTYVRIGIRDTGIGMDAETKRRCFEPFFTTKDRDPGSGLSMSGAGLGLAAAYALARRNGGRLVVDSRSGYGALFTIYIPVHEQAVEQEESSAMQESSSAAVDQSPSSALRVERIKGISPKEKAATTKKQTTKGNPQKGRIL